MKYEYKTTFNNVQWESRKPRNLKVVEPDGEGWEMVGFCVENTGDSAQAVTVVHTGGSFCSERTPSPACWDAFGGSPRTPASPPPRTSILWWTWKREKQPESDCQF